MSIDIGPQEASADDVIDAVTAAMQVSYREPGWRTAWEHVDTTDDSHLRSVQRERQQATDSEAGQ